jgi:hypothetical protein
MAQLNAAPQASRRPARDLIEAVVDNMRKNLEPLKYSTLAPSRFTVVHPTEFARIEGIILILEEQTIRALADELHTLNHRPSISVGSLGSRAISAADRQCPLGGRSSSARSRRRHE